MTPAERKARELDDAASALADAGKLAQAIPLWGEAMRQNPNDVDVLVHLGHALAAAGETEKAGQLATRAAQLAPKTAAPWFLVGQLQRAAGRYDAALEAFALARDVAADASLVDIDVARAEVLIAAGHVDEAAAAIEGVKADRVDVCLVRAFVAAAAGDKDGARAFLARGGEIDPLHPEPFKRLAMLMAELDRGVALELARHALELGPHDAETQALVAALQAA